MSERVEVDILPSSRPGRRSKADQAQFDRDLQAFADKIDGIAATLDFDVSSRGWGYILEGRNYITKGEFKRVEKLINLCRKSGLLPLDICIEDERRAAEGVEELDGDIEDELGAWRRTLERAHRNYTPHSFWDDKDCYLECVGEKSDLKSLFIKVCEPFRIAIHNMGGWADLHSRAAMIERFFRHWQAERRVILLYCGDFDPGGLNITAFIKKNLRDMAHAVAVKLGEDVDDIHAMLDALEIDRFGLNKDFIDAHDLMWIENLETANGKYPLDDKRHKDHDRDYVQSYIKRYGVRKVEANALLMKPEDGRELCLRTILKYLPEDAPEEYEAELHPLREELQVRIRHDFCLDGHPDPDAPRAPDKPPQPPEPPRARSFRVRIEDDGPGDMFRHFRVRIEDDDEE